MYNFVDTTEKNTSYSLPAEAVQFNGVWLDYEIEGFRTLYVSGRETIVANITELSTDTRDGTIYQRRNYEPRTLVIGFQLLAVGAAELQEKFNQLNRILDAEESRIVFNDELDKFFVGTKVAIDNIPTGVNNITAEIEIYCANPFKYSVEEFEVTPTLDNDTTYAVQYDGTYKSFPVLESEMQGDNGFVSYLHESGATLLFGNIEEVDGIDRDISESLVFTKQATPAEMMLAGWVLNGASLWSWDTQVGAFGQVPTARGTALGVSSYGTGVKWHGPAFTKEIPADSSGKKGAKNFTFSWDHLFYTSSAKQLGICYFVVTMVDEGVKKPLAAVQYTKNTASKNTAFFDLLVGNKAQKRVSFVCTENNEYTGKSYGRSNITKMGGKFTFTIGKRVYSFNDPTLADAEAFEVSLYIAAWETSPAVATNAMVAARFKAHNVEFWEDIPNKFSGGDTLMVNCENGEVLMDSAVEYGLGALGNNWEQFYLKPGLNQINCLYSSWAEKPNFKLKYREVFL